MNKHYEEAAKAKAQLPDEDSSNEAYIAEQGMTDEVMQFGALNRIAEATLALAYEQRTANLIALLASDIGVFNEDHLIQAEYRPLVSELKKRMGLA